MLKTCSVAAIPLGFGNYTPGTGALAANTTVNVKCTKTTPFTVTLNGGTTTGGNITQRLMTNGTDYAAVQPVYDARRFATLFGDGTTGVGVAVSAADWRALWRLLYTVACPTTLPTRPCRPGAYTDTVNVTVTY